jgi:hypothetical protein
LGDASEGGGVFPRAAIESIARVVWVRS